MSRFIHTKSGCIRLISAVRKVKCKLSLIICLSIACKVTFVKLYEIERYLSLKCQNYLIICLHFKRVIKKKNFVMLSKTKLFSIVAFYF